MQRNNQGMLRDGATYWLEKAQEGALLQAEFAHALNRSLIERMARGLMHTYKPQIDDAPYRVFARMGDYVTWCDQLPTWLGYGSSA